MKNYSEIWYRTFRESRLLGFLYSKQAIEVTLSPGFVTWVSMESINKLEKKKDYMVIFTNFLQQFGISFIFECGQHTTSELSFPITLSPIGVKDIYLFYYSGQKYLEILFVLLNTLVSQYQILLLNTLTEIHIYIFQVCFSTLYENCVSV